MKRREKYRRSKCSAWRRCWLAAFSRFTKRLRSANCLIDVKRAFYQLVGLVLVRTLRSPERARDKRTYGNVYSRRPSSRRARKRPGAAHASYGHGSRNSLRREEEGIDLTRGEREAGCADSPVGDGSQHDFYRAGGRWRGGKSHGEGLASRSGQREAASCGPVSYRDGCALGRSSAGC